MRYGERLQLAMDHLGKIKQRTIQRLEVAHVADCTTQNIGMILRGAQGDQKLNTEANYRVANFLRVNSHWLATEEGDMLTGVAPEQPAVSFEAKQLDLLLRSIPEDRRLKAYQTATQLLISFLAPAPLPESGAHTTELPDPSVAEAMRSASHQK